MNKITNVGLKQLKKKKDTHKEKEKIEKKKRKLMDKLYDFAIHKICPSCGKKLKWGKNCFVDRNEYIDNEVKIKCDCGFKYHWKNK